jgi:undecaprenyl-diphosphatase
MEGHTARSTREESKAGRVSSRVIPSSSANEQQADAHRPILTCHTIPARRAVTIVLASIAILVACSLVAVNDDVADWEVSVLEFFNGWPDGLEPILWVLQQAGLLVAPVAVGLVIVALTRRWQYLIPFVLVLPLKLIFEKGLVKQLVERERPFVSVGPEIVVRGTAFEGLSFPSGHATTAFALAVLVTAFLPARWRAVPMLWAVVVGVSRLYYGEHNLLDVVAGAAIGTAFGTVLWFLVLNRLAEPDDDPPVAP